MNRLSKQILGLIFLLTFSYSCSRDQRMPYLGLVEDAAIVLQAEKYILVVPQNGCSTCVKKSYDFIIQNFTNSNIKYTFTHYASKKAVKVRLRVLGKEDVSKIDFIELSLAKDYGISTFYPTLLELGSNGEAKIKLMNSEDMSDWAKLKESIKTE